MNKKGGNNKEQYEPLAFYDAKVIIGASFCVFVCFVIAMLFVQIGIGVEQQFEASIHASHATEGENIVHVLPVSYDVMRMDYTVDKYNEGQEQFHELLDEVGGEKDYYLIRSNTAYQNVLSKLEMMGATTEDEEFDLPDNFFESGSIILIAKEDPNLSDYHVRGLTRDEKYYIHINTIIEKEGSDIDDVRGKAVLIRIDNIQPRVIDIEADTATE